MTIDRKIVLDESGKPSAVLIPWDQFREIEKALGLDLSSDERGELTEALQDSRDGNSDAFVPIDEV